MAVKIYNANFWVKTSYARFYGDERRGSVHQNFGNCPLNWKIEIYIW